jgi:hypothetical protein
MQSRSTDTPIDWSAELSERQNKFTEWHSSIYHNSLQLYNTVACQVEKPTGSPQPAGTIPTIDDPDFGNSEQVLAVAVLQYVKGRIDIPAQAQRLFGYILSRLSTDALQHVESHEDYLHANKEKSPHLLLKIVHSVYNTDAQDNIPGAADISALQSLVCFKPKPNESLVVASARLLALCVEARSRHAIGASINDQALATLFLKSLPESQFASAKTVILNSSSMNPSLAPDSPEAVRLLLVKLGAPEKIEDGSVDAMSASASAAAAPKGKEANGRYTVPRPGSGYTCTGCRKADPGHFSSDCPLSSPAVREVALQRHKEDIAKKYGRATSGEGKGVGRGGSSRSAIKAGGGDGKGRAPDAKSKNVTFQASAADVERIAASVAERLVAATKQDSQKRNNNADESDDDYCGYIMIKEEDDVVSANTATARLGTVQSGTHYLDTGANRHVVGKVYVAGDTEVLGDEIRIRGVGGFVSRVTAQCKTLVRGTSAAIVLQDSPSLLSASELLKTHFIHSDRNGRFFLLYPRDMKSADYLVFVGVPKGLWALAVMYKGGTELDTVWSNEPLIRGADESTTKDWVSAVRRRQRRATSPQLNVRSDEQAHDVSDAEAMTTFAKKLVSASEPVAVKVKQHTAEQVERAKIAELYMRTLVTTPEKLRALLSSESIEGASISAKDVALAEHIFGANVTRLSTNLNSRPPHVDTTPRPEREHPNQVAFVDLFKCGGHNILLTKFKPLGLKLGKVLESRESQDVTGAVLGHIEFIRPYGYECKVIHSDKEGGLMSKDAKAEMAKRGIRQAEYATAAHVVHIESCVQPTRSAIHYLLQECVSTFGYTPPYEFLQSFLNHVCIMNAFTNYEPGNPLSTGQVLFGRSLTARECSFAPGSLVVSKVPRGTQPGKNVTHGEPCIYLCTRASETLTGSVYSLGTDKILPREINEFVPLPMTREVIEHLRKMVKENTKQGRALTLPPKPLKSLERVMSAEETSVCLSMPSLYERMESLADSMDRFPEEGFTSGEEKRTPTEPPHPETGETPKPLRTGNPFIPAYGIKLKNIIAIAAITRKKTAGAAMAFNLTVQQALDTFPEYAEDSIRLELENILHRTFRPVDWKRISRTQKILPSKMFLKPKWNSSGAFDKLKCRLVGGGHRQNHEDFGDLSAPTLGLTALFALLSIAVYLGQKSKCADVPSAYLNAPLKKEDGPIHVRLDKKTSEIVIKMRPELAHLADPSGRIVGEVEYALYGLIQSAMLWYEHLTKSLESLGFKVNEYEPCVMNKHSEDGTLITVGIFVDDMKFFSVSVELIDSTIASLEAIYGKLTVNGGDVQSYLGMTINTAVEGEVTITMEKYVTDILSDFKVVGTKSAPAKPTLLDVNEESPLLPQAECDIFRSKVMRIYYLARRVRPDMLTAAAFLTRRTTKATVEDADKLQHLLQYLNGTSTMGITLSPGASLQIYAFVDAAYGTHFDMKSHTGCVIQIGEGGGPTYCKSVKQSIVSKSSTEAELIAASDMASQIIWLRNFMQAQGHEMGPAILFQDNMSTIALINSGRAKAEKSRHVNVRYFWIRDRIESAEIVVEHKPTEHMLADALTKPLTGSLLLRMREMLLNNKKR